MDDMLTTEGTHCLIQPADQRCRIHAQGMRGRGVEVPIIGVQAVQADVWQRGQSVREL